MTTKHTKHRAKRATKSMRVNSTKCEPKATVATSPLRNRIDPASNPRVFHTGDINEQFHVNAAVYYLRRAADYKRLGATATFSDAGSSRWRTGEAIVNELMESAAAHAKLAGWRWRDGDHVLADVLVPFHGPHIIDSQWLALADRLSSRMVRTKTPPRQCSVCEAKGRRAHHGHVDMDAAMRSGYDPHTSLKAEAEGQHRSRWQMVDVHTYRCIACGTLYVNGRRADDSADQADTATIGDMLVTLGILSKALGEVLSLSVDESTPGMWHLSFGGLNLMTEEALLGLDGEPLATAKVSDAEGLRIALKRALVYVRERAWARAEATVEEANVIKNALAPR
jgi:hypothetical protein